MTQVHLHSNDTKQSSADLSVARFDTQRSAEKYAKAQINTPMHRREMKCIRRALSGLPPGSKVLDLPTGTGRLIPMLLDLGFEVTGADASSHMVDQAQSKVLRDDLSVDRVTLKVADARDTGFEDSAFDAVVCNRLLHHIQEPSERQAVFAELSRICSGPLVVSFFNRMAFDSVVFDVKNIVRGITPDDRIPIGAGEIAKDVEAVGRAVKRYLPVRPWVSKQCYLVVAPR